MNRHAFLKAAAAQLLELAGRSLGVWAGPGRVAPPEPPETENLDEWFLEAMRRGIDPAGLDRARLESLVTQPPADAPALAKHSTAKGGDPERGTDRPRP